MFQQHPFDFFFDAFKDFLEPLSFLSVFLEALALPDAAAVALFTTDAAFSVMLGAEDSGWAAAPAAAAAEPTDPMALSTAPGAAAIEPPTVPGAATAAGAPAVGETGGPASPV